jgi:hypothetical protein
VHPLAAGGDIGAHALRAGVPGGDAPQLVRALGTSTADLDALADGVIDRGSQPGALESPGVYGMPLFATRAARGRPCWLISAPAIPPGPGRQSAGRDGQWRPTLPSYGLFKAAWRPEAERVALRTLLRPRAPLLQPRAPHLLPRQQARWQMPRPLSPALRNGLGATGPRLIRSLGAGERDPHPLAALRNSRWQQERDEIAGALPGPWREEPLFVLQQAFALCACYPTPLSDCDARIACAFSVLKPHCAAAPKAPPLPRPTPPPRTPHAQSQNAPLGNTRAHLLRLPGVDLVAVPGLRTSIVQTMLSELGTDRRQGPDDKPCCSWRGLAPPHARSGGKV